MTRINCIAVSHLPDEMLVAEYREMLRVRHAYPRASRPIIPDSYRMGPGHETFFYDKGLYLVQRHESLVAEMNRRDYQANFDLDLGHWPPESMGGWQPDVLAQAVCLQRIHMRLMGDKSNEPILYADGFYTRCALDNTYPWER